MTWKPSNDFEEEIVSLQPEHDFIFGALSVPEPQPFYPRPKSHIEYAATKKRLLKNQQDEYETTGKFNDRLHVISQVQRIAGTKPLGEQPTVSDWDNDKDAEKEVVAMMRHFGLGPSVEEPLNEKVTIATYPVQKNVQVMQNGRRKVPVLFDDNLFKLKPKMSDSSSSCESESNNNPTNNDDADVMLSFSNRDQNLNTSSSSCDTNSNSFHTGGNLNDSNVSQTSYNKAQIERCTLLLQAERMHQYGKLHEEEVDDYNATTSQSRFSKARSSFYDENSFKTAINDIVPSTSEDRPKKMWLNSNAKDCIPSIICHHSNAKHETNKKNNHSNYLEESGDSSFITCSTNSNSKSSSLHQRFVISDTFNDSGTSSGSSLDLTSSSSSPILQQPSYANVARKSFPSKSPNCKSSPITGTTKSSIIQPSQLKFYTARELYERKRHALQ